MKTVITITFFILQLLFEMPGKAVADHTGITQFVLISPLAEISNFISTLKAGRSHELVRDVISSYDSQIFTIAGFCTVLALIFAGTLKASNRKQRHLLSKIDYLESKALTAQMNPHFIFNSLNSIQSLIANDSSTEAMAYVSKFSKLLRSVLENSNRQLISLQHELNNLKFYIELEALRLNCNVNYSIEVNPELLNDNEMIPPMIIQPIVENSLWHGLSTKTGIRAITIQVKAEDEFLRISITDNGIGRKAAKKYHSTSTGIGLSNTRRRISLFNECINKNFMWVDDLADSEDVPLGTRVTLLLKRNSLPKRKYRVMSIAEPA